MNTGAYLTRSIVFKDVKLVLGRWLRLADLGFVVVDVRKPGNLFASDCLEVLQDSQLFYFGVLLNKCDLIPY
jgi:hypothetical protein